MHQVNRIAEIAIFVASTAAIAATGQVLLNPQFHTWAAELVAVLMRVLSRL